MFIKFIIGMALTTMIWLSFFFLIILGIEKLGFHYIEYKKWHPLVILISIILGGVVAIWN